METLALSYRGGHVSHRQGMGHRSNLFGDLLENSFLSSGGPKYEKKARDPWLKFDLSAMWRDHNSAPFRVVVAAMLQRARFFHVLDGHFDGTDDRIERSSLKPVLF